MPPPWPLLAALPLAAAVSLATSLPSALPAWAISQLASDGIAIIPGWLPAPLTRALLADALALEREGLARPAGVGSRTSGTEQMRQDDDVRRSKLCSLYPPPRPSAGDVDTRLLLYDTMRGLCRELDATPLVGVEPLSPFDIELSYLYYPVEGYYKRHRDVPASDDGWYRLGRRPEDGGSFSEAAVRREVSVLIYLNEGWRAEWGGQLRAFPEAADAESLDALPVDGSLDVLPEGGTLVLFHSRRIPHEVLPTRRERQCIVGWFRTFRSRTH
jgi:SM-20-related protein|mmetsp:Transcript_30894/g.81885  ORF Transcript_30894/g.81885 Transcript_30894/m.81885 type:complete len:272 (+) Transcript_30894:67-882(+)